MRTIASMKMINYEWDAPIPITNPLIANRNNLHYNFHTYNAGGVAWVYYNLSCLTTTKVWVWVSGSIYLN
jgi:hypothetical protein